MKTKLLIIDPQNDFCDIPGAALPVAGAAADLGRVSRLVREAGAALCSITVTLDTHPQIAIERVSFWEDASAQPVAPFTQITESQVRAGLYRPRRRELLPQVITYLHDLEAAGRYRLTVWPVHCVLGTSGHNIHPALAAEIAGWEERSQTSSFKVLKGQNPMTEQYSAVRAEVPRADDPSTHSNEALLAQVRPAHDETLLIAGEAGSHCVRATTLDILESLTSEALRRVLLLTDCMSPVSGFEREMQQFLAQAKDEGARLATCEQALHGLLHQQ
jgi:nicotinamidase/pyrazinamidase